MPIITLPLPFRVLCACLCLCLQVVVGVDNCGLPRLNHKFPTDGYITTSPISSNLNLQLHLPTTFQLVSIFNRARSIIHFPPKLSFHLLLGIAMYPHPSPSSSRSSSRSNSFSTPDLACLDNPCQVSFEVRHSPDYQSRYRDNIHDCIILQKGDPCWVRIDGKWYVGLIISSSYLRQPAVSLCYLF